jgi:hypothetical protein
MKKREAYQQGILDGMCGFYSIINALYYLKPDLSPTKAEKLLRNLVKTKPRSFHKMYIEGTYFENVVDLMKHVVNYERGFSDINFKVLYQDDDFEDAYEYISCLNEEIDGKNSVAIISVGEPLHHWTVATKVNLKQNRLYLFDSYRQYYKHDYLDLDELDLKKKENRFQLYTYETLIVRKK